MMKSQHFFLSHHDFDLDINLFTQHTNHNSSTIHGIQQNKTRFFPERKRVGGGVWGKGGFLEEQMTEILIAAHGILTETFKSNISSGNLVTCQRRM